MQVLPHCTVLPCDNRPTAIAKGRKQLCGESCWRATVATKNIWSADVWLGTLDVPQLLPLHAVLRSAEGLDGRLAEGKLDFCAQHNG